jgi:septal ring factor EnvC (AmiA/AmiB activator)
MTVAPCHSRLSLQSQAVRNEVIAHTDQIIIRGRLLPLVKKGEALKFCSQMVLKNQNIAKQNQVLLRQLKNVAKSANQQLLQNQKEYLIADRQFKNSEDRYNDLKKQLAGLLSQVEDLKKELNSLKAAEQEIQLQIDREETLRFDASIDWIPFVGIIGGAITGRYTRMIPGFSSVSGIISHINQSKESYAKRLEQVSLEYKKVKNEYEKVYKAASEEEKNMGFWKKEKDRLKRLLEKKDLSISQAGKDLVSSKNVVVITRETIQTCSLLANRIEEIKEFVTLGEKDLVEREASSLMKLAKEMQKNFRSIEA